MSTTTSDMHARAYPHNSGICNPRQVTYMQKHITTSLLCVIHDEVACMQEHDAQNPGRTTPWSILLRACKTQGPSLASPIDSPHYVSNMCHFVRDTYARACQYVSSTCHPQRVSCTEEHNTCTARKTRQTQALHLVILTRS